MNCLWSFLLPFFTLLANTTCAQSIWRMRNEEVYLKNMIRPYTPLPANVRTYQVSTQIASDANLTALDAGKVKALFRLEAFEQKESDADLNIVVKIGKAQRYSKLVSYLDPQQQTWYYYEEKVVPQLTLDMRDRQNQALFVRKGGIAHYHYTPKQKTQGSAAEDHFLWQRSPAFNQLEEEACLINLKTWCNALKDQYDTKSEVISLYYPDDCDFVFAKTTRTIGETLMQLNKGTSIDSVSVALKPHIAFLEQTQAACNLKKQQGKRLYAACALNLAYINRTLGHYERVQQYMRQLIEIDYYHAIPQIKQLAASRERDQHYQYFQKNGQTQFEAEQALTNARFDSLQQRTEVDGYIVLHNGSKLEGAILNPVDNFNNSKVKLKYEKKLNAPVEDQEYPLEDIREVNLEGWRLGVLPRIGLSTGSGFIITEIIYPSPNATLHRTLPLLGYKHLNTVGRANLILQHEGQTDEYRIHEGYGTNDWLNSSFIKHLKSCKLIEDRLRYGYYTASQVMDVVMDYHTYCGSNDKAKASAKSGSSDKIKPSKSPGFYWGISGGFNNFTSVIGLSTNVRLKGKMFIRAGAGIGVWGPRLAAGLKYDLRRDMRYSKGWSFAFGYGYNRGFNGATPIGSERTVDGSTKEVAVDVKQKPVGTFNTSIIFNRMRKSKNCFTFELGYAISLQKEPWTILPGGKGAEYAKSTIKLAQPGGLILGLGLNFGR